MEQRKNIHPTNDKTHKAPCPLTAQENTRTETQRRIPRSTLKIGHYKASICDRSLYRIRHHLKVNTAILIFTLIDKHKHFM